MQSEQAVFDQPVARPLRVLVSLIHKDLEAAERAGMLYYRAAGEKMIEAKQQLQHGEFGPWITRNFKVSRTQAYRYMALAKADDAELFPTGNISSMHKFRRQHLGENAYTSRKTPPEWAEQAKRHLQDAASRTRERQVQFKLALEIINVGYRGLAAKLHPDVAGGSTEKMAALNQARDRLKRCA